mmetsp:Transcript_40049/g.115449  ORF Transcript_40049/g.115449 Transcript_40049/m.115449 type:complete len:262 (+) Transcript_40049:300-1085(+)
MEFMVALKAATWLIRANVHQADTTRGVAVAVDHWEDLVDVRLVDEPHLRRPRTAGGIEVGSLELLLPCLAVTLVAQDQGTYGAAHDGHRPKSSVLDDGVHSGLPLEILVISLQRHPALLMGVVLAVVVSQAEDAALMRGDARVELVQHQNVASPMEAVLARGIATTPKDELLTLPNQLTPGNQDTAATCAFPRKVRSPALGQEQMGSVRIRDAHVGRARQALPLPQVHASRRMRRTHLHGEELHQVEPLAVPAMVPQRQEV